VDIVGRPPLLGRIALTFHPSPSLNTNGQDKLGNAIFYQQLFLVKYLDKWRARLEQNPSITAERLHAVDVSLSRFIGLALEHVRLFHKPSRPRYLGYPESGDTCDEHSDWQPYPVPHTSIDWHPHCHYLAYTALAEIVSDDEAKYEERRRTPEPSLAHRFEELVQRVKAWPDTIKPCVRMHARAMPHVIALQ
jgi:hypothetical protein